MEANLKRMGARRGIRQIDLEARVSVLPLADFCSVPEHLRLGHRTAEYESCALRRGRNLDFPSIRAVADPRKRTGASRLFIRLLLAILDNRHDLNVIRLVERPGNCPVVRDANARPCFSIARKLPAGRKRCYDSRHARRSCRRRGILAYRLMRCADRGEHCDCDCKRCFIHADIPFLKMLYYFAQ